MGRMNEMQNIGQFDPFAREIIRDINSIIKRIGECEFVPKGMREVYDLLTDAYVAAEVSLSDDEFTRMHGDNLEA